MGTDFTHFKEEYLTNAEWAKEIRARLDDLNDLLSEAAGRDILVYGRVNMVAHTGFAEGKPQYGTVTLSLAERI